MQIKNKQQHSFHLVDPSPWPILASFTAFLLTVGGVLFMHGESSGKSLLKLALYILLFIMYFWWQDVVREGTFEGQHTQSVQTGLRMGVIFFIVSEVMFFLAFFWGFFHSSFNPASELGAVWPPVSLIVLNPWQIPLLNTIILLSSGASVTWAHHAIIAGDKKDALFALSVTIGLAIIFTALQVAEYLTASFTISDSVYGSTFYMATGFHGFHVFIGTCFLIVCLSRLKFDHFTREHHFGFEAAAWYWHFVDVVWLFLFVTIYWWGS